MKRLFLLPLLTASFAPAQTATPIFSEIQTGNGFLRRCSVLDPTTPPTHDAMDDFRFCAGYVSGLWDGMIATEGAANYKAFCPPLDPKTGSNEVDNGQLNAVFLKYLHSNPSRTHLPTAVLYFSALREAFPCRK